MARSLDDGNLHSQTDAEIGHGVLPCVLRGQYHARHTASPEAAWHQNAACARQSTGNVVRCQLLGVHPADVYGGPLGVAAVM